MPSFTHAKALQIAEEVVGWLRPGCERIEIVGSLREGQQRVSEIEIAAVPAPRRDAFGSDLGPPTALDELLVDLVAEARLARSFDKTRFEHTRTRLAVWIVPDPREVKPCPPPAS